jgi:hypothetical protein
MRATNWSVPVPNTVAYRRACGRRRYNAARRQQRDERRYRVFTLYWEILASRLPGIPKHWGVGTLIARQLGVSRATVCRDLQRMPNYLLTGPRGTFWPEMARRRRSAA